MDAYLQLIRKIGKGTGIFADIDRRKAQEYLEKCVDAFPVWVMPLDIVWNNIKPKPGMFDVVIVDEASQCGLEAVPLFYMAKKIVIVGDDEQTSPENVGFKAETVRDLFNKYVADINFSDVKFDKDSSLFNIGGYSCSAKIPLREHFRCMPEIISFSDKHFYSDIGLTPLKQYGRDRLPPLVDVYVENASREKDKNHREADEIVERICRICKDKRYDEKTIGVISLHGGGGAQAKLIERKLLEKLGPKEMDNRSIKCAHPKNFQGDERDIIILSLVVASNEDKKHLPLTGQRDRQRFNVAASRAREQMILFHSISVRDYRHRDCLRRDLLEFFEEGSKRSNSQIDSRAITGGMLDEKARNEANPFPFFRQKCPPAPFENWFEVDVARELLDRKYTVISQYTIAKHKFDIAIVGKKAIVAVECDGDQWEGADKYDKEIEHQRKLERCGWKIFRVRGSAFYADREKCLKPLLDMLKERGIKPEN
jgi:very-short-patch-repair endonuclease